MSHPRRSVSKAHLILWNARGMIRKLSELKNYLIKTEPLIFAITETHLNSKHHPKFKNYNIIRKDRSDGYGGLAILCHRSLVTRECIITSFQGGEMENLSFQYEYQNKWSAFILL